MPNKKKKKTVAGRYAYEGLDRILHEKARLGIMTCLMAHIEGLVFNDLKERCSLTDGNLSRHIQILNEAGLVEVWKGYEKRRPQTLCRLTPEGRKRFSEYLKILGKVIGDALPASKGKARARELPQGWVPV